MISPSSWHPCELSYHLDGTEITVKFPSLRHEMISALWSTTVSTASAEQLRSMNFRGKRGPNTGPPESKEELSRRRRGRQDPRSLSRIVLDW